MTQTEEFKKLWLEAAQGGEEVLLGMEGFALQWEDVTTHSMQTHSIHRRSPKTLEKYLSHILVPHPNGL